MIRVGQNLVVPVRQYESAIENASPQQPMRVQYSAAPPVRPLDRIVITDRGLQRSPDRELQTPVRTASAERSSNENSSSETVAAGPPASDASSSESSRAAPAASESADDGSAASSPQTPSTVTVRRGDNLSAIASRHGVDLRDLKRWNRLGSSRIHPGQTLRLTPPEAGSTTYTVRRGDSLDRIARLHGVSVQELRSWNDLRGSRIYPGQTLDIRDAGDRPIIYTVQRGDTLSTIAQSYGTSVGQLRMLNQLRGSQIYPGQKLKIQSN